MSSAGASSTALEDAIETAERYMKELKLAKDAEARRELSLKCQRALQHAEALRIAKDVGQRYAEETKRVVRVPFSGLPLTRREKILLLESSKLNDCLFPPWEKPPESSDFEVDGNGYLFTDNIELRLSENQLKIFDGWKRPDEVLPPRHSSLVTPRDSDSLTMISQGVVDLVQDVTTDCSVVASLCAGTARAEKGWPKILSTVVFPYDHSSQKPTKSANGKYVFRMNFNGCLRKVVIDDKLPASKSDRVLHVIDRNNPGLLWPALLEKAYLKVRGGYDFPGSNSGTDIWVMTGWIPESVFLNSDFMEPDRLWWRVFHSFEKGEVLVTIGTRSLTSKEQSDLGLASEHDYAVLQMKEIEGQRLLLVKNPWAQGLAWKGELSLLQKYDESEGEFALRRHSLSPGTFWIDLENVLQSFETFYLNWDPSLFRYKRDRHFTWDVTELETAVSCDSNPQFALKCERTEEVWLLLDRHFKTQEDRELALSSDSYSAAKAKLGYISLLVFDAEGVRVSLNSSALHRGELVDSPQTLMRFPAKTGKTYTAVVVQHSLPVGRYTFTLSAFSTSNASLDLARERYAYSVVANSAWTSCTAGGRAGSFAYPTNPQWSLKIPRDGSAEILLKVTKSQEAPHVHVAVAWGHGKRVSKLTTRDVLGQSGEYCKACCIVSIRHVPAGIYTVICSTFHPNQLVDFELKVSSDVDCSLSPIPAEGAGRFSLRPESAILSPKTSNQCMAPLHYTHMTRLLVIARYAEETRSVRTPIKITIEYGQDLSKKVLASSNDGDFCDDAMGVRVPDITLLVPMLQTGGVWVVLESLDVNSASERVQLELLSESRVSLGPWGFGER